MKKLDSNNDSIFQLELTLVKEKLLKVETENARLTQIIKDNDLDEELGIDAFISNEEHICVKEISRLKELSDKALFTQEDAKTLDILYKTLSSIRGKAPVKEKKTKAADITELFKIVEEK
jgi:hypothetical protein